MIFSSAPAGDWPTYDSLKKSVARSGQTAQKVEEVKKMFMSLTKLCQQDLKVSSKLKLELSDRGCCSFKKYLSDILLTFSRFRLDIWTGSWRCGVGFMNRWKM